MEKAKEQQILITKSVKKEINWAKYLDYTNFNAGETNNIVLELFTKDFNGKSD
ncbi:MAG: hypothetical protein ACTSV5_07650 [Promethearchaeota archaeon]